MIDLWKKNRMKKRAGVTDNRTKATWVLLMLPPHNPCVTPPIMPNPTICPASRFHFHFKCDVTPLHPPVQLVLLRWASAVGEPIGFYVFLYCYLVVACATGLLGAFSVPWAFIWFDRVLLGHSEPFQSSFRAVSGHSQCIYWAFSYQFIHRYFEWSEDVFHWASQSNFSAVSEQFQSSFRGVHMNSLVTITISESRCHWAFQSTLSAVSEQFSFGSLIGIWP